MTAMQLICGMVSICVCLDRPRLGVVLHRVVGVGLIYFVLASIEGCTRALQPRNSSQNQASGAPALISVIYNFLRDSCLHM